MALDVYFRHDVEDHITGTAAAMLSAAIAHGPNIEYCRGVIDMAMAQTYSFGLSQDKMKNRMYVVLVRLGANELIEELSNALTCVG